MKSDKTDIEKKQASHSVANDEPIHIIHSHDDCEWSIPYATFFNIKVAQQPFRAEIQIHSSSCHGAELIPWQ